MGEEEGGEAEEFEVWLDLTDTALWRKLFNTKTIGNSKVYFRVRGQQISQVISPMDKRKQQQQQQREEKEEEQHG
jgi:hypothetical protein